MLQIFTVPEGGRQINTQAAFFQYQRANNKPGQSQIIRVRADGQDLGEYLPGDAITLPVQATTWEIVPESLTTKCVVRLGVAGVESSRIYGEVEVIESGAGRSMSGNQYISSTSIQNAGFAVVGIKAKTRTLAIKQIIAASPTAGAIVFGRAIGDGTSNADSGPVMNKQISIFASDCVNTVGITAASAPVEAELPSYVQFMRIYVGGNSTQMISLNEPIIVPPGHTFVGRSETAARLLSVGFELEEL